MTSEELLAAADHSGARRDAHRAQSIYKIGPNLRCNTLERIDQLIVLIDTALTNQVNRILHHPTFQALEARWRGLAYLVNTTLDNRSIIIKVLTASWREICRDLDKASEFDQSHFFSLVYSQEFGMAGGKPFGLLVGDYQVGHRINPDHQADDVGALRAIAGVAAAAFAPIIFEARPELLQLDHYSDLDRLPDIDNVFETLEFVRWQSLRALEDCRFLGLLGPRILMRLPLQSYCRKRADGFLFEEHVRSDGNELLWGNPSYAFARIVIRSFADCGWFADLRGAPQDADLRGLVTDLPTLSFATDRPGVAVQPAVEIRLTSAQERCFSDHGLIPVGCAPFTPYVVFNSNSSLHRPNRTQSRVVNENARIGSMLQYVLCASRFAHYLKVMLRDRLGSSETPGSIETSLNVWLRQYCVGNDDAPPELKAKYPLRDASVSVRELAGRPGVLGCTLRLQPHFQLDDVAASFQLVAGFSTSALS